MSGICEISKASFDRIIVVSCEDETYCDEDPKSSSMAKKLAPNWESSQTVSISRSIECSSNDQKSISPNFRVPSYNNLQPLSPNWWDPSTNQKELSPNWRNPSSIQRELSPTWRNPSPQDQRALSPTWRNPSPQDQRALSPTWRNPSPKDQRALSPNWRNPSPNDQIARSPNWRKHSSKDHRSSSPNWRASSSNPPSRYQSRSQNCRQPRPFETKNVGNTKPVCYANSGGDARTRGDNKPLSDAMIVDALKSVPESDMVFLDSSNFQQVFTSPLPWLVMFSAPWCGPCKKMKPAFQLAATKLKGKVHLGFLNGDLEQNQGLVQKFAEEGFPSLYHFPANGGIPEMYGGGRKTEEIVKWARAFILG